MKDFKKIYKFYWLTGSQDLYGQEVLEKVKKNTLEIIEFLNKNENIQYKIEFLDIATNEKIIKNSIKKVNYDNNCAGIIIWMHTFSPAKMWINGLKILNKPLLHFSTQFNENIDNENIDMDYMNLHQSAHGDRETAFITSRLNIPRKIIAGFYQNDVVLKKINKWLPIAIAFNESQKLKIARFGDNMRNVAVTEGDKLEAHIKLGWNVDYYSTEHILNSMDLFNEIDIDKFSNSLKKEYNIDIENNTKDFFEKQLNYQIKLYLGIKKFLIENEYNAFTTNFQNLFGLEQLPGLAVQLLLKDGFGFAGEGDWKTAGLVYLEKVISNNDSTGFIETYTYDFKKEITLGAHMLEVDPTYAIEKGTIVVRKLGIGDKTDPARLIFNGKTGKAVSSALIDTRKNLTLVSENLEAIQNHLTPKLPVGKLEWKNELELCDSIEKWMVIGGSHHTALSFKVDDEQLNDLANLLKIKYVSTSNIKK